MYLSYLYSVKILKKLPFTPRRHFSRALFSCTCYFWSNTKRDTYLIFHTAQILCTLTHFSLMLWVIDIFYTPHASLLDKCLLSKFKYLIFIQLVSIYILSWPLKLYDFEPRNALHTGNTSMLMLFFQSTSSKLFIEFKLKINAVASIRRFIIYQYISSL